MSEYKDHWGGKKVRQIVLVEWIDSSSRAGWEPLDEAVGLDDYVICTAGVLLKKTANDVLVALSYSEEHRHVNGTIQIPRCLVRSMRIVGTFRPDQMAKRKKR